MSRLLLLSILLRSDRIFSAMGFLIDSLNMWLSTEPIEVIDAFGSMVEFRLDRKTEAIGFFRATKLILLRRPLVMDPVRMSLGFLAELNIPDGAIINESVDISDMLSKLSRFRLFVPSRTPDCSSSMFWRSFPPPESSFKIGDKLAVFAEKSDPPKPSVRTAPSRLWLVELRTVLGLELFGVSSESIVWRFRLWFSLKEECSNVPGDSGGFGGEWSSIDMSSGCSELGEGIVSGKWLAVLEIIWNGWIGDGEASAT